MKNNLSIEEKLHLLTGADNWSICTFNGKLPSITMNDGPNGHKRFVDNTSFNVAIKPSVNYPNYSLASCSWDNEMFKLQAKCHADDFIEGKADIALCPGINIKRTPLNGRNFEYVSEDPYFAGHFGKTYIKTMQDKGIGTSLKHYAVNNREYERNQCSCEVDERTLHEIYLKNFRIAVESQPWTIMCSYNKINGVYASENKKLLNDYLRYDMGFEGLVVSDWCAVHNSYKAVKAGCDLAMPYNSKAYDNLKNAYDSGILTIEEIDTCVNRILTLLDKNEKAKKIRKIETTLEERLQATVTIAENSMVLLKNDNDTLPLKQGEKVGIHGEFAYTPTQNGGGSAYLPPIKAQIPLHLELEKILGYDVAFNMATHYSETKEHISLNGLVNSVVMACEQDVNVVVVGNQWYLEGESYDRHTIKIGPEQVDLIKEIAKVSKKTVVVLEVGSAVDVSDWIDLVDAVVLAGFAGNGTNSALANILTGKVNPSGKLTETYPICLEDCFIKKVDGVAMYDKYDDGVFVGYRYFDKFNIPVRFPFGYGLSYSKFEYSNLKVKKVGDTDFEISYDITNVSDVDGQEVSQIYVRDQLSAVDRPVRELVEYEKTFVKAGATVTVTKKLDRKAFEYYLPAISNFYVENGYFFIEVGASSRDIKLSERIKIELPDETQYTYSDIKL